MSLLVVFSFCCKKKLKEKKNIKKKNTILGKHKEISLDYGLALAKLRDHKFKHSFGDTLNLYCTCNLELQTNSHIKLH